MNSANQLYKSYKKEGGNLSFADWMSLAKQNHLNWDGAAIPVNKPLTDSINTVLNNIQRDAGYKPEAEKKYILGIHKNILIAGAIVILAGSAILIYKKVKK